MLEIILESSIITEVLKGGNMAYQQSGGFGGPREMHKAVCAECKKECEVPFKPREGGKPILCKECYSKSKGQSR
jgi:CxxC-x17-CxxC domain-containing protein